MKKTALLALALAACLPAYAAPTAAETATATDNG